MAKLKDLMEGLKMREGTWAIPETQKQLDKAAGLLRELCALQSKFYNVIGDDSVFDGIDQAIRESNALLLGVAKSKGLKFKEVEC